MMNQTVSPLYMYQLSKNPSLVITIINNNIIKIVMNIAQC